MKLTEAIRKKIIVEYCVFCVFLFFYKYFTNGLLSQVVPVFFYNKLDFTTILFLKTGLQKLFLHNFIFCFLADVFYYLLPFIYLWVYLKKMKLIPILGSLIFAYNLLYSVAYCSFPTDSLEGHIALIVFPIVFIPFTLQGFWFMLQGVRYFFLFFFSSAGLWKLAHAGVFNFEEMSAILLYQHKELLITDKPSFLITFYKWLIANPFASYWLYFSSTIIELFFIIGFFTKKYDRLLALLFLLFLIMDAVIMRIDYWETLPFLLCLLFSKYRFIDGKSSIAANQSLEQVSF
ncbi:MAG: hypothetical protein ACTHMD_00190 [Flavisolibacter sp.]